MCTMMAGVMLVALGLTGMGTAVKFFPRPVVIGFTNGIALLIASTQIRDLLGLQVDRIPGEFLTRLVHMARDAESLSLHATALSAGTIALILVWNRFIKRVPGTVVALFLGTAIAWGFHLPVDTI